MNAPTTLNKNHLEVGVYEERNPTNYRKGSLEDERLQKELKKFDPEIEAKLQQSKQWQHEMYKDFEDPSAPTLIEFLEKSIETLTGMMKLKDSLFEAYQQDRIKVLLPNLFQVLENLHRQYEMLSEILQVENNSAKDIAAIHEKYKDLGELALPIQNQSQICWKILANCFDYLLKKLLLGVHKTIQYLFDKKGSAADSEKIDEIQIAIGKIRTVSEYLPVAATFDQSDIFALEQSDPYLQELHKFVKIKVLGSSETVKKSFQRFIQGIHVGVSMYAKASVKEGYFAKKMTISFGAAYYYLLSSEAQKQANLFYSQPHEKSVFELWNILEDEFVASMMKITLPSIKYAEKIHIKRLYEPVTLELINDALNSKSLNNTSALNYSIQLTNPSEELATLRVQGKVNSDIDRKGSNKVPILVLAPKNLEVRKDSSVKMETKGDLELSPLTEIVVEKNPKAKKSEKIETEEPLKPRDYDGCGIFAVLNGLGCLARPDFERGEPTFKELIIHIHGGGFVSMSSSSHQSYTRQWANILKKPVFSIDYRLAPEHPYPAALDDCWQAYNWILDHSHEVLGIRPENIIITGDSAGGNLALGVSALAVKCGIKVPDGIFLAYPALRLEVKAFSPSLMYALEDQLIPYTLLKLCISSYVPGNSNPALDPLLSPIHLSEELLRKLPAIRIMVGDADPLHDECWRFTDKLRKIGHDVFLTVYRDMCHGFLGYDVPMGMAESKVCIQDAANMIAELLEKVKTTTSKK